jgi:penicillin amidase
LSRALPLLRRLLDMPPEPLPGDLNMPRVQAPDNGASERLVVLPGSEENGFFHMPGGQSGHPLSPYYRAGHSAWAHGEGTPFLSGQTQHRLTLVAASPR